MLNIITLHLIDNRNLLIPGDIYQSAITLKLLRGEVNVIDRLITVAPVRGLRCITQRVNNHFLIYWCLFTTGLLQLTPGLSLRAIWPLELILNSAAQLSWLKKTCLFLPHHPIATFLSLASCICPHFIWNTCLQSQKCISTHLPQSTYHTPHCTTLPLVI